MKPTKSQRIALVLELEQRKEQAEMEALRQARLYLDQQTAQLSNLQSYHEQYLQSLKASMQGAVNLGQLQSYQGFIDQVASAMEQQQLVVEHAQVAFDRAKHAWQLIHEKCRNLKELVQRYHNQERLAKEKQEERQLEDDMLVRRFKHRH